MHISPILLLPLATLSYGKKASDSGVEYVRACDSGSDDVTNMCINRIPDDIGQSSGNHACAYHEAEVKCLGLCGNTLTWKVAYQNALKRYRLVCASYIDERLAEKEEEGDGGEADAEEKPKPKPKKESDDEDADAEENKKKPAKKPQPQPQAKNSTSGSQAKTTQADAKDAKEKKGAKPSMTASASKAASSTAAPRSTTTINLDDLLQQAGKKRSTRSKPSGEERSLKGQAMLPSMDPELAGAAGRAPCVWALAAAALSVAAMC
ncbi:hypothetical protein GGI15_003993 [Coemansia interrupta]|uniref:Uncharacterized protein n=1 Tax=Coemansia interrupta TaxID=1126814 RepID=A0A9W8H6A6_9FUNG|nr:hypothetical protein GGI15_003993 [Coemansia interrupta]